MPIRTVIHFIDSRVVGGAERIALQTMTGLDRQDWRPVLFHHGEPGLATLVELAGQHAITNRVVPRMESVHDLAQMPHFWRTLRAEEPTVFHAHLTWPLSCKYGLLAAVLARIPAVVATAHTRLPIREPLRGQPKVVAHLVDRYLAVSDAVAGQLRNDFGIDASQVEVVRNGIDGRRFIVERSAALRTALTNGRRGPVVLTVARLDDGKGHRDLLRAATLVPDALFALAGDGPLRTSLESDARMLGVSHRVLFLGERQDVPALLACADLFVLPSLSEGLPLSVLEAMAAGVPVVATAIAGIDEMITNGCTGLLVPPGDPAALAEAIHSVCRRPEHARSMARAARERVLNEFTRDDMVTHVTRIYGEVLAA